MIKYRISVCILTAVLAALLSGCSGTADGDADDVSRATEFAPFVASTVRPHEAVLRDRITGSGTVAGRQEAVIRAKTGGTVTEIAFELGDTLQQGEVLLRLDDTVSRLNVVQLERQFASSAADLETRRRQFNQGAISRTQLDQAEANHAGIESQLSQAREALEAARITAPISGGIAEKRSNLVIGDQIQPGEQIARIIDLRELRISLPVGQNQIFLIAPGNRSEITVTAAGRQYTAEGRVAAVSAGSDQRTGSWEVLVDFPNPAPEVMRSGVSANVTIFREDVPVQTVVPAEAVVEREGTPGVFLLRGEHARWTAVEVLDRHGDFSAVAPAESGIDLLDEEVITSGLTRMQDGDRVVTGPRTQ